MFIKRGDGKIVSVFDTEDLKKNKKAIKKLKDMIKESESLEEENNEENIDSDKLNKTKE